MKAITFLGAGRAHETVYVMPDGRQHTAPFFGVALARFYPDLSMRVFVTRKAREMHLAHFQVLVKAYVADLEPVDIPDGANEEELWALFQAVVDQIEDRESVIFDITHGFRSLPFLSLLAVAYLRTVKAIDLQAVLYGNFEARDRSVEPHRAPVIDLSQFVDLFDWMTAADRFIRFGDARDLAAQLRETRPDPAAASPEELREWSYSVGSAAGALEQVSTALRLIRPAEAMEASQALRVRLLDATGRIGQHARPFRPLSQRVVDAYTPLALGTETLEQDPVTTLAVERDLVRWYLERNQLVQAIAVAREWLVTWAMLHLGHDDVLDRGLRGEVEKAFGGLLRARRAKKITLAESLFADLPQAELAVELLGQIGEVRNDILHAGKRQGAQSARNLERRVRKLCSRLMDLPLPGCPNIPPADGSMDDARAAETDRDQASPSNP